MKAKQEGQIQGLLLNRHSPIITNAVFADDTLLFGRASRHEASKLKEIISSYTEATGQRVNFLKSSIYFSKKTPVVLRQLNSLVFNFWWGRKDKEKKLQLISWKDATNRKDKGGMGFKDFKLFNLASSPFLQKAKLLGLEKPSERKKYVEGRHQHNVGDGRDTLIWYDPWVPHVQDFKVQRPSHCPLDINHGFDLIDHDNLQWKNELVVHYLKKRFGAYSVRSGYRFLLDKANQSIIHSPSNSLSIPQHIWKKLWNLPLQPKIKVFVWKALLNALPVKGNLAHRGIPINSTCPICNEETKSIEHIMFWCSHARATWFSSCCNYKPDAIGFNSFTQWWIAITQAFSIDDDSLCLIAIVCWIIRKQRNMAVF
ncbi:uncharacterized protein LOC131175862 [Hevea brasiliensis]|uniref:uncharacterized protein LOC131175862 n=1 Tax=Hevea brasiliensis TaxID=3981 RepID=UPI0025DDE82F|nr:uncharacterized protein LOC131175862 [Hevea brasiliensis]